MKRSSLFINRVLTLNNVAITVRLFFIALVSIALVSCSDDDEPSAFHSKLGSYQVSDLFEADEEPEEYEISFTKNTLGEPHIQITNFGDIMNVPINGSIEGDSLHIPSQTFKGKSMTIKISGKGKFAGNNLAFDYVIETNDDYVLEHSCEAVKK